MKKIKQDGKLLEKLKLKFDEIYSVTWPEREQCIEDRRFATIAGAQWEGNLKDQFENKPRPEVNKVKQAIIRIINERRNNKITVNYISKKGEEKDNLAETCGDFFRGIEDDSNSTEADDNTFEDGITGGFGAMRVTNQDLDDYEYDNDSQKLVIKPIYDAESSVFFDLDAKAYDKSDAYCCFVISGMTKSKFENLYGDDISSWDLNITNNVGRQFDWVNSDEVYVAEYFEVVEETETLYIYKDLYGKKHYYFESELEDEELMSFIEDYKYELIKETEAKRRRVIKRVMCGDRFLEEESYIPGKCIPVIPFYGIRWYIQGIERYCGHTRLLKDIQRIGNVQRAKLMEIAALSSISKPIFTPEQMAGHQELWAEDNLMQNPYLLVNEITDDNGNVIPAGPLAYTKAPEVPQALASLIALSDNDMKEMTGNAEQGEKVVSNFSGKAMETVQKRIDMQSYIYMSNWAKTKKRLGEVVLSMIPDVYVEKNRKVKGIGEQSETRSIELMKPMENDKGELYFENDLSQARFDVKTVIGPSSISKRDQLIRTLTEILPYTQDPTTQAAITSSIITNMEGDGLSDIKNYFRMRLVREGVIEPTEKEKEILQREQEAAAQQPPSADQKYLETESQKNEADVLKKLAEAEETQAKSENERANTLKTLYEIGGDIDDLREIKTVELDEQIG